MAGFPGCVVAAALTDSSSFASPASIPGCTAASPLSAAATFPSDSASFPRSDSRGAGISGTDFVDQIVSQTPLARAGTPDDIAKVAVFLASDEAGWLTGEKINASGGLR